MTSSEFNPPISTLFPKLSFTHKLIDTFLKHFVSTDLLIILDHFIPLIFFPFLPYKNPYKIPLVSNFRKERGKKTKIILLLRSRRFRQRIQGGRQDCEKSHVLNFFSPPLPQRFENVSSCHVPTPSPPFTTEARNRGSIIRGAWKAGKRRRKRKEQSSRVERLVPGHEGERRSRKLRRAAIVARIATFHPFCRYPGNRG